MNTFHRYTITAAATIASLTLGVTANAAVMLDNLAELPRADTIIQQDPDTTVDPPVELPWAAQSFLTHGNASTLDSITVLFGGLVDAPKPVLELRADAGGTSPDVASAPLALFNFSPIPNGAPTAVVLTPDRTVSLAASTLYWLVVGATGDGQFTWRYAAGNDSTGLPGASLANYAYSTNQGMSWANFGSDNPYQMRIEVTPESVGVPAPSGAVVVGLGALALGTLRRRLRG